MATTLSQEVLSVGRNKALVVTVFQNIVRAESDALPRMLSDAGKVAQLQRTGDARQLVSQTDIDTVAFTGNVGDEILLVSFHDDPIATLR